MNLLQRLLPFLRKAEPHACLKIESAPPSPPESVPWPPPLPPEPWPPPKRIQREALVRHNRPGWKGDFPPTIGETPQKSDDPGPPANMYFDPALKHYQRAFRRGDPVLPPTEMAQWQDARRRAMQHLLEVIADSAWAGQLVLRGSVALKAMLGERAREPGDIDWVVQPDSLRMDEPAGKALLDGVIAAAQRRPRAGGVVFDTEAIARNDIWTYERAPGHRIVFPWRFGALPPAAVQMDFVFQEFLHTPPQVIDVTLCDAPSVRIRVASDEESLAWKLVWLFSDMHPQGKDLYDAVVLAERASLSGKLLKQVMTDADCWRPGGLRNTFPFAGYNGGLEWGGMPAGLPSNDEEGAALAARMEELLRPAVEECLALTGAAGSTPLGGID